LPAWLGADGHLSVPRRPLLLIAAVGVAVLGCLLAGLGTTEELVRATSACFIAVYLLVLASAVRILAGRRRLLAAITLALMIVLAVFSSWYLLVPVGAGGIALALKRRQRSTVTA